jgi:hypothetical protein
MTANIEDEAAEKSAMARKAFTTFVRASGKRPWSFGQAGRPTYRQLGRL